MASIAAAEPVKVAALQMTSAADVALNLAVAARLLSEARAAGARVAVLPENFSFMGVRDVDKRAIAEPDGDGPVQNFLSQQARELGLWIVGGTPPIRPPRGALRQDAFIRRRHSGESRELPGVEQHRARRARGAGADAGRAARTVGVL